MSAGIVGRPEVTVWHSRDGGPWSKIRIGAATIVAARLRDARFGEVYDDGYGNAYARHDPENPEGTP